MNGQIALWLAFVMGVLARWGDRIQFVLSEQPDRTVWGFIKQNWIRLLVRASVTGYVFYLVLSEGWVSNNFIAFSIGLSADVLLESILDRAKRTGESVLKKNGSVGGSGGQSLPSSNEPKG